MLSTNLIASEQMGICNKLHLAKERPLICHHLTCTMCPRSSERSVHPGPAS